MLNRNQKIKPKKSNPFLMACKALFSNPKKSFKLTVSDLY